MIDPIEDARELARVRRRETVRRGWQYFLEIHLWQLFATLTMRDATPVRLRRAFTSYIARMEKYHRKTVRYAYVLEGVASGTPHIHALLYAEGGIDRMAAAVFWKAGRAEATPFDPAREAGSYLTKEIDADGDLAIELSQILPPVHGSSR